MSLKLMWCDVHFCVVHFLSLQVYHDSEEGQRYIQFYKLNKFPYISILDPRTGECFYGE